MFRDSRLSGKRGYYEDQPSQQNGSNRPRQGVEPSKVSSLMTLLQTSLAVSATAAAVAQSPVSGLPSSESGTHVWRKDGLNIVNLRNSSEVLRLVVRDARGVAAATITVPVAAAAHPAPSATAATTNHAAGGAPPAAAAAAAAAGDGPAASNAVQQFLKNQLSLMWAHGDDPQLRSSTGSNNTSSTLKQTTLSHPEPKPSAASPPSSAAQRAPPVAQQQPFQLLPDAVKPTPTFSAAVSAPPTVALFHDLLWGSADGGVGQSSDDDVALRAASILSGLSGLLDDDTPTKDSGASMQELLSALAAPKSPAAAPPAAAKPAPVPAQTHVQQHLPAGIAPKPPSLAAPLGVLPAGAQILTAVRPGGAGGPQFQVLHNPSPQLLQQLQAQGAFQQMRQQPQMMHGGQMVQQGNVQVVQITQQQLQQLQLQGGFAGGMTARPMAMQPMTMHPQQQQLQPMQYRQQQQNVPQQQQQVGGAFRVLSAPQQPVVQQFVAQQEQPQQQQPQQITQQQLQQLQQQLLQAQQVQKVQQVQQQQGGPSQQQPIQQVRMLSHEQYLQLQQKGFEVRKLTVAASSLGVNVAAVPFVPNASN